ncbi:FIST N-terminal domain-containing protein [uncultured Maribacter sp.]|uniref:FIST signal transduction protein n=1 Tax=uncultured Maribacter sp. TaxID=431308 RepID=UPI002624226C|nr:FIST N-terminal domain-containing protein [uncultured Maribacter sp.]
MKIQQAVKKENSLWEFVGSNEDLQNPLVLVFGNRFLLENENIYEEIRSIYPNGEIVFGSTSGEILGDSVMDNTLCLTAIEFQKSSFVVKKANIKTYNGNVELLGTELLKKLPEENLRHIFVVSEGSTINGSTLIMGLEKFLSKKVTISGGLCGDDSRFEKTIASYNNNPKEGEIIVIGLYGESLEVSCANYGGWTAFGPERIVTKSENNVLFELDEKPALDLYKQYLGDKVKDLPEAALLYPLSVKVKDQEETIVRTILNINEKENSMTLAGDIPEGSIVQLMMSTVDDIVEGAYTAAEYAMRDRKAKPELALLVSCVGRKLVMDQRSEEEVEEVIEVIGNQAKVSGFYSYGEMAPFAGQNKCRLHNQTMTLTLISE